MADEPFDFHFLTVKVQVTVQACFETCIRPCTLASLALRRREFCSCEFLSPVHAPPQSPAHNVHGKHDRCFLHAAVHFPRGKAPLSFRRSRFFGDYFDKFLALLNYLKHTMCHDGSGSRIFLPRRHGCCHGQLSTCRLRSAFDLRADSSRLTSRTACLECWSPRWRQ